MRISAPNFFGLGNVMYLLSYITKLHLGKLKSYEKSLHNFCTYSVQHLDEIWVSDLISMEPIQNTRAGTV